MSPHARLFDPTTSHLAAMSMAGHLTDQQTQVLEVIRHAGHTGATAHDIARRLTTPHWDAQANVMARRCTDLADAGLVVNAGTRPGATGRPRIVWVDARLAQDGAA
ncbi:MAG TPA: hypothetical protein VGE43_19585 [Acidimicrobiales bacterium]